MLKINDKGNYVFTDPTFKKSFEGVNKCSVTTLHHTIREFYCNHVDLSDYFQTLWQKSVYNLIKTIDYKHFKRIENEFIDNIDDKFRFLIASNKNTSRDSLYILQNDPISVIKEAARTTLNYINTANPAEMNEIEFFDWLERASVEDLESFSGKLDVPV